MDIIFLSYEESNAEDNWARLSARFPRAKRVHGVKGLYKAHRKAADVSESEFFFLVDGDNRVSSDFDFTLGEIQPQLNTIYVWRCLNPVNNLAYGYGAIKLYNKSLLEAPKLEFQDLATTVASRYQIIHIVASETHFFSTPLEAWRGAFRECAKLRSQVIKNPDDRYSAERLKVWCEQANQDIENAHWVLKGANMGSDLALELAGDLSKIKAQINQFDKLKETFLQIS